MPLSSSNFLGVVFFGDFGFHLRSFIFLLFSTLTGFIDEDGEILVSTFIVVGDVDFIVVIIVDVDDIDGSVSIMDTVFIVDNTVGVGSVIACTVVIVVGDVNDTVVVVINVVVVVSVVVFLLSFLLL